MTKKKKKMGGIRQGAGRPVELKGSVKKQVVLDRVTVEKITRYADHTRISFSASLRALISKARI